MIDIKKYIKKRTIQEINMVNIIIEVNNNHPCRKEGWTYINNVDFSSEIENILYHEGMKDIYLNRYMEYDNDVVLDIKFVNINNKKLEDFQKMVDVIGNYIHNVRKNKGRISTVNKVQDWLNKNLEKIVNQYR